VAYFHFAISLQVDLANEIAPAALTRSGVFVSGGFGFRKRLKPSTQRCHRQQSAFSSFDRLEATSAEFPIQRTSSYADDTASFGNTDS